MPNPRTFDLNLIRVFEAISHDRSVSAAADKLGLSQSAVSNALSRLRREFDDPLFIRGRRGMEPTPRAMELALLFQEAMARIRGGLGAGTTFDPTTATKCFNLLMTDLGEILFLPVILAKLSQEAPGVDLNIIQAGLERYEEFLEEGVVDLAIGRVRLSETLHSELIHSSPFVVLCWRENRYLDHDEAGMPALSLERYMAAPHVNIDWPGPTNSPLRRALGDQAGRRRLAVSLPHTTVLPMILERTDLLATIPKVFADKLLTNHELCTCPPPFPIEQNFVYQWWHRRNDSDAANRWLRSLFSDVRV